MSPVLAAVDFPAVRELGLLEEGGDALVDPNRGGGEVGLDNRMNELVRERPGPGPAFMMISRVAG